MYRLISLFAGIGGIDLAFERAGFKTVAQVERDPFCLAVLAKHWPDVPRIEDVKDAGRHNLPATDVLAGGFPCFAPGTLILTDQGYTSIESVQVGDRVLTHTGRFQPVTSVMRRDNAPLHTVKAQGIPELITTPEHPFYARLKVRRWNNDQRQYRIEHGAIGWVEAQNLTDHMVGQVLPPEDDQGRSEAFWRLVGRYLADGWRVQRKNRKTGGRVVICSAGSKETELARIIEAAGYRATRVQDRTAVKYHIVNRALYDYLEAYGHYAYGKRLTGEALRLPAHKARALIEGYRSDGYYDEQGHGWSITTTSKELAYGISLLAQRAYERLASVSRCSRPETCVIEGRTVNQHDTYTVRIYDAESRSSFIEEGYGWRTIRQTRPANTTGTVFNLSVARDESYMADNLIVHNCQPVSVAGKRRGTQDERWLWPEFARLIGELRPRIAFLENVPGLLTAGGTTVLADLAALGYDAEWGVIPASAAGAPHRRERWFCVAYPCSTERRAEYPRTSAMVGQSSLSTQWQEATGRFGPGGEELADTPRGSHTHQSRRADSEAMGSAESGAGNRVERGDSAEGIRDGRRITPSRSEDVADAFRNEPQRERRPGDVGGATSRNQGAEEERERIRDAAGRSGALVGLPTSARFPLLGYSRAADAEPSSANWRLPQSGVGGDASRLPGGVDGHRWPARPGEAQYEWEAPRTVKAGTVPNRAARLRALGNAVVPQQVEPIARAIYAYLQEQDR